MTTSWPKPMPPSPSSRNRRLFTILYMPRKGMRVMMPQKASTKPHQFHFGMPSSGWMAIMRPTPIMMVPLT